MYLCEESIWRVPAFFHTLHPHYVGLFLTVSHSSLLPSLAVIEKYNALYMYRLVSIYYMPLTGQEMDGSGIKPPHLFWNLEVEPMNRCENNVVTEVKQ